MPAAKEAYIVTETAGRYVAGQRVTVGQELSLTEGQAAYELARGLIRPKNAEVQKAATQQEGAQQEPAPALEAPAAHDLPEAESAPAEHPAA